MAELDYAFLAQFAKVNGDGTLTALEASFLRMTVAEGSGVVPVAVAGRIRFPGEPYSAHLEVHFLSPGGNVVQYGLLAQADKPSEYGDGRRHVLFALNTAVSAQEGEHRIEIMIDDQLVRTLIFNLELAPTAEV